ncbi:helix-turn-helix domain-containing protein [Spirillospora sp. CA-294931]|uniref:helix-turn-helix domain-containing protein n=1 Tax=Spirillospora sp. CA-294931 TaxID=3240042 RepID=UPI003D8D9D8E
MNGAPGWDIAGDIDSSFTVRSFVVFCVTASVLPRTLVTLDGSFGKFVAVEGMLFVVRKSPDPTISIYHFMAYYLRFLRLQHKATQVQVGEIIGCSDSQVSKYESGEKRLDGGQCAALDEAWKTGGLFAIMLGYAKLGTDTKWPERRDRYQRRAKEHHIFASNLIPLPLQTESYARGLLEAGHAGGFLDDVESALARRMEIQDAMLEDDPDIWVVLDEIALRPMGPASVMADQRDKLLQMSTLRNVSLRILPQSATPNIGLDGSFHVFTLPDRRLAAFSGTVLRVGRIIDDQVEAARVAKRFQRIAARSWSEDQSREHIARMGEI